MGQNLGAARLMAVSQGQDVGKGHSNLKAWLGLEDSLLRLLAVALGESLSSSAWGFSTALLEHPYNMVGSLLQNEVIQESREHSSDFSDLVSLATCCHLSFILFTRQTQVTKPSPHWRRGELGSTFWREWKRISRHGALGWLSWLSICLQLRSWSWGPVFKPQVVPPSGKPAPPSAIPHCLCSVAVTLCQTNKQILKKRKKTRISGHVLNYHN